MMGVSIVGLVKKSRDFQAKGFNAWITRTLKKAKNTIKTKRSSVLFNLFVGAVSGSASLLFWSRWLGCWLDGWPGHRWCSVNGLRSRCRLVRMILMERADELPKVLDR